MREARFGHALTGVLHAAVRRSETHHLAHCLFGASGHTKPPIWTNRQVTLVNIDSRTVAHTIRRPIA